MVNPDDLGGVMKAFKTLAKKLLSISQNQHSLPKWSPDGGAIAVKTLDVQVP